MRGVVDLGSDDELDLLGPGGLDAGAQNGRVDEALEPARAMLARVQGMESGRLHDRMRSVRNALAARSSAPEVREFSEACDEELRMGL